MKKLGTGIACLLTACLLCGCGGPASVIKSYSDTALNTSSLIINTNTSDDYDFFAKDLVIFPKSSTVSISETDETLETDESSETKSTTKETTEETTDETETTTEETEDEEVDIDAETGLLAGTSTLTGVYCKAVYDRVYPASVTKIMTALITLEKANFSDKVIFTEDMVVDEYGAKLCGFEVGDELTVEQLFYGLLIYSGNDAANALAIHIGGSIDGFAAMMNQEAKNLGCVDTHFVNPSGLHDSDHYTSAYDLYLIFDACLKYDKFHETIRQTSYDIKYKDASGETIETTYETTNQYFLDVYDYPESVRVLGGKTGTTDEAGSCLILYDEDKKGNGYVSLILGAVDSQELYAEMNILLNKIPK